MRNLFIPVFLLFTMVSCKKERNSEYYCDFPPARTNLHMFRFIPRDSTGNNMLISNYGKVSDINLIQACNRQKNRADTFRGALRLYVDLAPDYVTMCDAFLVEWKDADIDTISVIHSYEQVGCGKSHIIKEFFYNGRKMVQDTAYNDPYILTLSKQ